MYIFIDESGAFQATQRENQVSCISALVIPESFAATLFRKFKRLTRDWRDGGREVKGSTLDETQIAAVIRLLRRFDVLLFVSCIDMGFHDENGITAHKNDQAQRFLTSITTDTPPTMRAELEGLATQISTLSNQLYAQSATLNALVDRATRAATLYYCQRIPKTLGSFKWRIDAKGENLTPYENLWKTIVMPFLQDRSLKDPARIGPPW